MRSFLCEEDNEAEIKSKHLCYIDRSYSFAISRCKKGIHLENALLWEIKRFYPQEFELGRYAVELVKRDWM